MQAITNGKSQSGFTMMELVVSISIITLVTTVFLANYHGTDKKTRLTMAAQKLATEIRLAQNYSLSTKEFSAGTGVPGGWGLRADSASPNNSFYRIFADLNNNRTYDANESYVSINLPKDVTISNLTPAAPLNIVFLPPDPVVYINASTGVSATLTLTDASGNTKTVTLNSVGLVEAN